jgi:hypothetical protein
MYRGDQLTVILISLPVSPDVGNRVNIDHFALDQLSLQQADFYQKWMLTTFKK